MIVVPQAELRLNGERWLAHIPPVVLRGQICKKKKMTVCPMLVAPVLEAAVVPGDGYVLPLMELAQRAELALARGQAGPGAMQVRVTDGGTRTEAADLAAQDGQGAGIPMGIPDTASRPRIQLPTV